MRIPKVGDIWLVNYPYITPGNMEKIRPAIIKGFKEEHECEGALNVYGFSKLFFDNYLRNLASKNKLTGQVVGLRYFNVFGPQENHKGKMNSLVFQMWNQYKAEGKVKLFGEYGGYGAGEHTRDFIYVKDVVKVNFWFWDHPSKSGIYNCGTGKAHEFNVLAKVANYFQFSTNILEKVWINWSMWIFRKF